MEITPQEILSGKLKKRKDDRYGYQAFTNGESGAESVAQVAATLKQKLAEKMRDIGENPDEFTWTSRTVAESPRVTTVIVEAMPK